VTEGLQLLSLPDLLLLVPPGDPGTEGVLNKWRLKVGSGTVEWSPLLGGAEQGPGVGWGACASALAVREEAVDRHWPAQGGRWHGKGIGQHQELKSLGDQLCPGKDRGLNLASSNLGSTPAWPLTR
jgi:hypothetical protein